MYTHSACLQLVKDIFGQVSTVPYIHNRSTGWMGLITKYVCSSCLYQYQRTQKELLSCWNLKSHQRTCHTGKNPGQIKRWFNFERSTANIKHHQLKIIIKNIKSNIALGVYLSTYLHFTC